MKLERRISGVIFAKNFLEVEVAAMYDSCPSEDVEVEFCVNGLTHKKVLLRNSANKLNLVNVSLGGASVLSWGSILYLRDWKSRAIIISSVVTVGDLFSPPSPIQDDPRYVGETKQSFEKYYQNHSDCLSVKQILYR